MKYTFRIKFNRAPSSPILTDASEIQLPAPEAGICLSLRAMSNKSLKDAEQWALFGEGYKSETDARDAGNRFQDTLILAFGKLLLGVHFGTRPKRGLRLAHVESKPPGKAFLDVDGLSVYPSDPNLLFVNLSGGPFVTVTSPDRFQAAFRSALEQGRPLTCRERIAFNLFSASYFQPKDDTRFLLQIMAVEALIEQEPKSDEAIAYVTDFIAKINASPLADHEKSSLIGSLGLLQKESITQAGRRLATRILGQKLYNGKPAPTFFSDAYSLRGALVHGDLPEPEAISRISTHMELFVSDLLTIPLLGSV
jgi:hypothetical protein